MHTTTGPHALVADALSRIIEPEQTRSVRRYLEALDDIADGHPVESFASLQRDFIADAAGYAERHRIQFKTWVAAGVPADVLTRAGIFPRQVMTTYSRPQPSAGQRQS